MAKRIIGTRLVKPEIGGYPDRVSCIDETNGMTLFSFPRFRTSPNPFQPKTNASWEDVYALIKPGLYPWVCKVTLKHGKCLALNDEGPIPTINPDHNNGGAFIAYAVLHHCGFSPTWPGSAACQTVHPDDWENFISHFELGETGLYELIDETGMQSIS